MFERWRLILAIGLALSFALVTTQADTLPKLITGVCYMASIGLGGFILLFKERL
jgi:hypothetical protein